MFLLLLDLTIKLVLVQLPLQLSQLKSELWQSSKEALTSIT